MCEVPIFPLYSEITNRSSIGTENSSFTCAWNYKWSNEIPGKVENAGTCSMNLNFISASWAMNGSITCIGIRFNIHISPFFLFFPYLSVLLSFLFCLVNKLPWPSGRGVYPKSSKL